MIIVGHHSAVTYMSIEPVNQSNCKIVAITLTSMESTQTSMGKPEPDSLVSKEPQSAENNAISKPKAKANHPPVAKMVNSAIKSLNRRGGSSVRAIKKYIAANFMVDPEKMSPFIKRYLAKAVHKKILIQTKGTGLTGSFKLAPDDLKQPPKRHVTASGSTKEGTKKIRKPTSKVRKSSSKTQSRASSRRSLEKKASEMSNLSVKVEKNKA